VLLQEVHDLLEDIRSKKQEKKTTIEKKIAETEIGKEARDCVAFNSYRVRKYRQFHVSARV
jgi:hypothetical protein